MSPLKWKSKANRELKRNEGDSMKNLDDKNEETLQDDYFVIRWRGKLSGIIR